MAKRIAMHFYYVFKTKLINCFLSTHQPKTGVSYFLISVLFVIKLFLILKIAPFKPTCPKYVAPYPHYPQSRSGKNPVYNLVIATFLLLIGICRCVKTTLHGTPGTLPYRSVILWCTRF